MIIEGLMTTQNADLTTNVSAMGPLVDDRFENFVLRPYQTSTTFANIKARGEAVFHVTDNVELIARAALDRLDAMPPLIPAQQIGCPIIESACRWYELKVESIDDRQLRTEVVCRVLHHGTRREFVGFCRAKHAVIEAAILASRQHLISRTELANAYQQLGVIVGKTAGPQEQRAFKFLQSYIREAS